MNSKHLFSLEPSTLKLFRHHDARYYVEKYKNLHFTDQEVLENAVLRKYVYVQNKKVILNKAKLDKHEGMKKVFERHTDLT
jgi:hypothetical protein